MNQQHIAWSRDLFDHMSENGVWGIPRSGLVFTRIKDELVLTSKMPYMPGMEDILTPEQLVAQQAREFAAVKEHFEAAGIPVREAVT